MMNETNNAPTDNEETNYGYVIYFYDRNARGEVHKALRAILEVKSLRGVRDYAFQSAAEINRDLGYHYTDYGQTRISLARWEAEILGDAIREVGLGSELYGVNDSIGG